jgi:hypothetical protein
MTRNWHVLIAFTLRAAHCAPGDLLLDRGAPSVPKPAAGADFIYRSAPAISLCILD